MSCDEHAHPIIFIRSIAISTKQEKLGHISFIIYEWDDQIKESEMGIACRKHRRQNI